MRPMIITRSINAPIENVFETVADIRNFSKALPHIVNVEFLTEQQSGLGTRFRETRLMNGKEAATELEVTEYQSNERIRLVADSHGTVWNTLFTTSQTEDGPTELVMSMEAKPYKIVPKLMNPLISKLIRKAVESDMDGVKTYCEQSSSEPAT